MPRKLFHRAKLLTFLIVAVLVLSGFLARVPFSAVSASSNSSACTPQNTLKMTMVVPPTSINPNTLATGTSGGYFIGEEYYGSPVPFPNGTLDYGLSIFDWIHHNNNYTVWSFNVKPGLVWSDGQSVNASDVLTTFGPTYGFNATYDYLGMGTEVQREYAYNSSEAVFVLNVSDAHWPDKFNWDLYTPVFPASLINSQGPAFSNLGTNTVVGPFYISNYSAGQTQMVMLRNPYFNPQPAACQIDVNFVESLALTTAGIESGAVDLAPIEPSNAQAVMSSNTNVHIIDEKAQFISAIQYNDSLYPYNMTEFRQALAYGIDKTNYVNQALDGYGVPASNAEGIVPPTASTWYNSAIQNYSYNPTTAISLLSSIGITKGSDGHLHYANGTVVTLNLWTDTDNTEDTIGASAIQNNLQQLGFQVNLHTTSLSNIVGYYNSNTQGITSAMILYTFDGVVWGNPYLDSLPGWDVYWPATVPNPNWEYPPSANNEYNSNYSAFLGTANQTQEQTYLYNIEALNAKYLPTLVVAYPDYLWAYNSKSWAGWPSGYLDFGAAILNNTALATIHPASVTSSSSSSTSSSTSQPATTSSGTTSTNFSTTSSKSSVAMNWSIVWVVVAVALAAGAILIVRRGPDPDKKLAR